MYRLINILEKNLDSIYLIFGNGVSRFLLIISTFIMIKLLGDEIYSEYAVLYNGILSLQVVATFGLNAIATKKIAQGENTTYVLMKTVRMTGLITCIFFTLSYIILELNLISSISYFKNLNFIVILISVYSLVFFSLVVSVLYGKMEQRKIAITNVVNSVILLFLLSASSVLKNLDLIFLSFGISNFLSAFLAIFFIAKDSFRKFNYSEIHTSYSLDYLKQSLPIFLSALLVTPVIGVVYTLMNKYSLGDNIAVFSVAMQWYAIILFIPGVIANLLLATFSKITSKITINKYLKQVLINFLITTFISLLVFIILLYVLPIYGKNYNDNIVIFVIFIITAVINSLNTVIGQLFISIGKQWFGFFFNTIWAITLLTLILFFLKNDYGIYGIAWSFLITYSLHALLQNIYVVIYFRGLGNE